MSTVVPILVYHGIAPSSSPAMAPYTVDPQTFSYQLDAIKSRGMRCVTISELVRIYRSETKYEITEPLIALTFDDGYADFAQYALPLMEARGIPSTLYVTSGWIDGGSIAPTTRPNEQFLSWSMLRDIANAKVEIGSHSHTHPQMDTIGKMAILDELIRSRALIEDAIERHVGAFAYPHGYNSPTVRKLTKDVGYDNATAVRNALSHPDDSQYGLARLMVFSDTSTETFENWLDGHKTPIATRRTNVKTLGWRYVRRGRAVLTQKIGTDYR